MTQIDHQHFMTEALREARQGLAEGGIPIGSVLVLDGEIVGRGHNRRVQRDLDAKVLNDHGCIALMQAFIESHPELWNEDIGVTPHPAPAPESPRP